MKKGSPITSKRTVRYRKINEERRPCIVYKERGKVKQRVLHDKRRRQYPRRTLFKKSKYKKYEEMVSFKNPESAEGSVRQLETEYRDAKTRGKKLRVAQVTQYSSNRAYAMTIKEDLSDTERKELRKIGRIYKKSARKMWKSYKKTK